MVKLMLRGHLALIGYNGDIHTDDDLTRLVLKNLRPQQAIHPASAGNHMAMLAVECFRATILEPADLKASAEARYGRSPTPTPAPE